MAEVKTFELIICLKKEMMVDHLCPRWARLESIIDLLDGGSYLVLYTGFSPL